MDNEAYKKFTKYEAHRQTRENEWSSILVEVNMLLYQFHMHLVDLVQKDMNWIVFGQ